VTIPEDEHWRRPANPVPDRERPPDGTPWRPEYAGPPPSAPPPPGWRPELVVQPSPPRPLPPQDHADLDAREQSARTLTYGIGLVAGAILLIVLCALCGRALF
jgi:hypothetical protein